MPEIRTLTHDEWIAEGRKLFGDDMLDWRFVCPVCGNVQSPNDFEVHKDKGAIPESAAKLCIGRFLPESKRREALGDNPPNAKQKPCDYASFGLFNLCPVKVTLPDGGPTIPVFGFAPKEPANA